MICSKYNILFKFDKLGYLIYNSLSNFFAELDSDTYHKLKRLQNNQEEIETFEDIDFLLKKKIIVEMMLMNLID
jgi:hypothetical protein